MIEPVDTFRKEWPVIKAAPWSVFTISVVVAVIVWLIFRFLHKREVTTLKASVELGEQRIRAAAEVIRNQRPSGTAFSGLPNSDLKREALALAKRIRRYYEQECEAEADIERADSQISGTWADLEAYRRRAEEKRDERTRSRGAHFKSTFKIDAVLLRNEMIFRLPPGQPPGGIWGPGGEYHFPLSQYEEIDSLWKLEMIANNLEALAKLLPNATPPSGP